MNRRSLRFYSLMLTWVLRARWYTWGGQQHANLVINCAA